MEEEGARVSKNNTTILLSLDTSTKDTGIGIFENGKFSRSQVIDVSKVKDSTIRMNEMISSLYHLFDELKPAIIVAELTSVMRNPDTQRKLTMVLGAIMGKCIDMKCPYYFYRPSEWRSIIKDKGEKLPRKREELKQWAIEKCHKLGYENVIDDNEAEAILIGYAYIKQMSEMVEMEE